MLEGGSTSVHYWEEGKRSGRRKSNLKGKIINYLSSSSHLISVDDVDLIIIISMHVVNGVSEGACEVTTKQPKCIICICVLILSFCICILYSH